MENVLESWAEIAITVKTEDIETAGNIANMVVPYGIYIEDYSAIEEDAAEISHYDFIDESLLNKDRTKGIIHIYVNPHENPLEAASFITERLNSENIQHEIKIADCRTEDWVNNWKQYFHAMPIGEKLLIRPLWEEEYDAGGRTVLNIEPGLAFGTGSHPTTKLCLETLEKYIDENSTVLDIGCGSGILSIASLLLGAKSAFCVDIDKLAVKTAIENAKENGFESPVFDAVNGNLSDKVSGKYNVIVANIVADIIMQFNEEVGNFLEDGGIYITGGIIDIRKDEVVHSFEQNGFEILANYEEKGWNVFVCKRR
ncbi:MAG: 50S ribosomal protein L11 methyltransferase [Clostridiales bacterium]|nr:50S ribosomal protein L11 methyltransferase [Clostridiales bacterium]